MCIRDRSGPTTNGEETIRELARKHFPQATEIPPEIYDSVRNISSKDLDGKYGEYVSPELVRRSMRMFKPNKAPGPDGFKPVMFKHLPAAFFERLAFIYKACLHFHYTRGSGGRLGWSSYLSQVKLLTGKHLALGRSASPTI